MPSPRFPASGRARVPRRRALATAASVTLAALASFLPSRVAAVPAFPGAEGFGANATGGRGGSVYVVTNLNDSGAGSLRDAISQPNRTVVFAVGGLITIDARLVFSRNLTIAGQTAPGEGITVYGNGVSFSNAHQSIVRYLRFRMGAGGDSGKDGVGIADGDDMIFDHVSASWGRDETFSISGPVNRVTIQDSIIAQGLQTHSCGGLMETDGGVSIFRTLYIDNHTRNPKVKGVNDFRNNVVYNWGGGGCYIMGDSSSKSYVNVLGNYFINGPSASSGAFSRGNTNFSIHAADNWQDSDKDGVLDGRLLTQADYTSHVWITTPYPYPAPTTPLTAQQAYAHVAAHAGASFPRDRVDQRLITELTSLGTLGQTISNENSAPMLGPGPIAGGPAPTDTDLDGMPDEWELATGSNPAVQDHNADPDGDGYTRLEDYINSLAPGGVQTCAITHVTPDTGTSATDGITSAAQVTLHGTAPAGATVTLRRYGTGSLGTTTADAAGVWSFNYNAVTLPAGLSAFSAFATTTAGVSGPPTPAFRVRVDTTGPAAPVLASVSLSPTLTINGTAEPGTLVTVALTGTGTVGSVTTPASGAWSVPYGGTPPGPGLLSFTATTSADVAGNPGATSASYTVDTTLAAPALTSITTDTGTSSSDRITSDATLIYTGTATAGSLVTLSRTGAGVLGSATADESGLWTINATAAALPAGTHSLLATATGASGFVSPASPPIALTIDATAPTATGSRRHDPTASSTVAPEVTYRVDFSEAVTGVSSGDFTLTKTGTANGTVATVTAESATRYFVLVTAVAGDGTLRLDLKASGTGITDTAGNVQSAAFTSGQTYTVRPAGSGVWVAPEDGAWTDVFHWQEEQPAGGVGAYADFSTLDLVDPLYVTLDAPRTIGALLIGDTDTSSVATPFFVSPAGVSPAPALTLAPSSGSPVLTVNALGSGVLASLRVPLAGTAGLSKAGAGALVLNDATSTLSGPISVSAGRLRIGSGATLAASTVDVASGGAIFEVNGGTFTATGTATVNAGSSSTLLVAGGTAHFHGLVTTNNTSGAIIRFSGGTVTAGTVRVQRNSDSGFSYGSNGFLMQGGTATVANVILASNNSWGTGTMTGGALTVTSQLTIGNQATSGRGGGLRMSAGTLTVPDTNYGIVLSRKNGSNANNDADLELLGGTTTAGRITLGYDSTVTAGSATVLLNGATLYLGAGGLVKNGTSGLGTTVTLQSGTLGAAADWSTSVPLALPSGNTLTLLAADATANARTITLGGALSGAGGFTKLGLGTLVLSSASNSFTGGVLVSAGTLQVDGTLSATGALTVSGSSSVLAGAGNAARAITLQSGARIRPTGTLRAASLAWQAGGILTADLALAHQLQLTGALTKANSGTFPVAPLASTLLTPGAVLPLATFASTTFASAGDFTLTDPASHRGVLVLSPTALSYRVTGAGPSAEFAHWAYGQNFTGPDAAPTADPNADGVPNLLAFALAHDLAPAGAAPAAFTTWTDSGTSLVYPAITFTRRRTLGGVTTGVEASTDLTFATLLATTSVATTILDAAREQVTVRTTTSLATAPRQFLRVLAALP